MDEGKKWKNFYDFDEPSGPADVVLPSVPFSDQVKSSSDQVKSSSDQVKSSDEPSGPADVIHSAPSFDQVESRSWTESVPWFPWHKPSVKIRYQVNRIPHRRVEDSGHEVKAGPDSPQVRVPTAAPGKRWLSSPIWAVVVGLLIWFVVLPVIRKAAHQPPYALFDLDGWEEIQRIMDPLQSIVQSERFSNSKQIRATVNQAQISIHRCRFLGEDVSTDLGTIVMTGVQEWVFNGKCTPALPVAVRRSNVKIQRALDCTNHIGSVFTNATGEVQEARSSDNETSTTITRRYYSPFTRASPEQIAIDNERLNTVRQSFSNLTFIQSYLVNVTKSHRLEHERLESLKVDMGRLDHLVRHPPKGTITPGEDQTSTWDCRDFDIPALRDSFFALAVTAIRDSEKIGQFQSRYYSTSLDSNA